MSSQMVWNVVIGIAVVALLLYRQLQIRPVRTDRGPRLIVILAAIGLFQLVRYTADGGKVGAIGVACLVVSLLIGAGLAAARAMTVKVWRTGGGWMRQGTALTLVLWLVSIGLHFLIDWLGGEIAPQDHVSQLGSVTIVLYLAVVLGVQNVLLTRRVATLAHGGPTAAG
jgi:hypothetical protein